MRKIITFSFIISISYFCSCAAPPREDGGKSKISAICRAQKTFLKKQGHYGTVKELVGEKLIDDNMFRNFGFSQDVKITETGYFAIVIPNDFTKSPMFYVDEKSIIRTHYKNTNIQPNDPECLYSNGAKCPCYED